MDIPAIDWIVQYDPPNEPKEYIHRVGRTARAGGAGRALLFLLPEELAFLKYLKLARVPLSEYEVPQAKLAPVQVQYEKLVMKNYYLHKSARDAYRSYLHAYNSHSLKDVYNVHKLDLAGVASSFGFDNPPKVTLMLKVSGQAGERRAKKRREGVLDRQPVRRGSKKAGDTRQWSH